MKTLILFTIFILPVISATEILPSLGGVGGGLYAQIVNIPDPIFKARLIVEGVDTNMDGEIQVSEAEAVTGMLDVSIFFADPIYDLTGIEAFINITGLNVELNQLSILDLSNNMALTELDCGLNNLTYLNVENCPDLEILQASVNQLTSMDLTPNINLKEVDFYKNQLTYLDIRNGNNTNITGYFHSGNNPDLTCIFVDDAEYSENAPNWWKDPASTYVETEAECDALGVNDVLFHKVQIFPNPVKDILYIGMPDHFRDIEIIITDIKGNKILHSITTQLDVSSLRSGLYFVILKDLQTKETLTKKLIKR